MIVPPRQLVLDLAHRPALGAEDFLVSGSNAAAVAMIDRWPDWPHASAIIAGPARSGKTHLAHVWQLRSGAGIVSGPSLGEDALPLLARCRALIVEDVDRGLASERALFHLLNLAREEGGSLLLTSARPAGELQIGLADLRSRMRALPIVRIDPPDESLLRALLVKLFYDRQLAVGPHVVGHIARHIERATAAAARVVEEIDREALATHRKVTRALAAAVMERLSRQEAIEPGSDRAF